MTLVANDIVGMDNIVFGYPQVYAQDGTVTTAALTLRTSQDPFSIPGTTDFAYYVTKGSQGGNGECAQPPEVDDPGPPCYLDPDCATQSFGGGLCPAQTAGTVHAYWNRPGVPNCWKNFVPCFARNTSGQTPPVQGDAAIGLQLETSLQPAGSAGDTYEFTLITTYGFRPTPPVFFPPETTTALVEFDREDGCAEFFFSLKNVNPGGSPPMPDPINEFYMDIEAGAPDPASDDCRSDILSNVEPPMGFTASICKPFDANGHGVVKFTGGSIEPDLIGRGRIKIDTNGLTAFTNTDTGITVPPLAIVVSMSQNHPDDDFDADAACASGDIGPSADDGGLWSVPISTVAFQAVPSLNTVAKSVLTLAVCGLAVGLMLRARRNGIA